MFERNLAGDTAHTIAIQCKNTRAAEILQGCQAEFDDSEQKTDELMAELLGQDEKNEKARQKKKDKKHRSKLQKLADKNKCTIDELETHFKKEEERKKQEEQDREMAALMAEQEAEQAVKRAR